MLTNQSNLPVKTIAPFAKKAYTSGQFTLPGDVKKQSKDIKGHNEVPELSDEIKNLMKDKWIVHMKEEPALRHTGSQQHVATKPAAGTKINPNATHVKAYCDHLCRTHDDACAAIQGEKICDYMFAFNGWAGKFSSKKAAQLQTRDDVLSVIPAQISHMDTATTPSFLGLDEAKGIWQKAGIPKPPPMPTKCNKYRCSWCKDRLHKNKCCKCKTHDVKKKSDAVIIGVIDSGIWPESLCFSDRVNPQGIPSVDGALSYEPLCPDQWRGSCQEGEQFHKEHCNNKLIGAKWFNDGWGGDEAIKNLFPFEYISPRDYNGHGTHIASTAGGNYKTPVYDSIISKTFTEVSGIAPCARIAVYKVSWSGEFYNIDVYSAIDACVADGVDVINFSLGSTRIPFFGTNLAFLTAAEAGIFVSKSSGNNANWELAEGNAPWMTTVGATTHDRSCTGIVKLGDGSTYTGVTINPYLTGPAETVLAEDVKYDSVISSDANLLFANTLDPAKAAGKIIVGDRGITPHASKSAEVKRAGGIGLIFCNTTNDTLNDDIHSVPTIHVQNTDRDAIRDYVSTSSKPVSTLNPVTCNLVSAPYNSSFTSGGPLPYYYEIELMTINTTAPGVNILAAVAPTAANNYESFAFYSGTSMSAPHVAGLAALLKKLYPCWSPGEIKSAIMTNGIDILNEYETPVLKTYMQGGGFIQPNKSCDPGLVFPVGIKDYLGFLCEPGLLTPEDCEQLKNEGYPITTANYNDPSIELLYLITPRTVKRTVKNVSKHTSTYTYEVIGDSLDVTVSPAEFTLAPYATQELEITVVGNNNSMVHNDSSSYKKRNVVHLVWSDKIHYVRIPVIAQFNSNIDYPKTPIESTENPVVYDVKTYYEGSFDVEIISPLLCVKRTPEIIGDDSAYYYGYILDLMNNDLFSSPPPVNPNLIKIPINVPVGQYYLKVVLPYEQFANNPDYTYVDLDIGIVNPSLTAAYISGFPPGYDEVISLPENVQTALEPGTWMLYIVNWETKQTVPGTPISFDVFITTVASSGETVTASASQNTAPGDPIQITVTFNNLDPDCLEYITKVKYLNLPSEDDGAETVVVYNPPP